MYVRYIPDATLSDCFQVELEGRIIGTVDKNRSGSWRWALPLKPGKIRSTASRYIFGSRAAAAAKLIYVTTGYRVTAGV